MEDLKKTVGKNVHDRRLELNMTMEELALKVGYKTRSSIYRIEKGIADIPNTKVPELASALNVSTAYLLGADEDPEELKLAALQDAFEKRPEMRMLFSVAEDCTAEEIQQAVKIIEALKK